MKHLIIYDDPNQETISREILQVCTQVLSEEDAVFKVCNVEDLHIQDTDSIQNPIQNPNYLGQQEAILDVQRDIMEASKITFICGVWKGMLSKNVRIFIDKIFTQEFTFNLLAGGKNGVTCKKRIGFISIELIPDYDGEAAEFEKNNHDIEYKDVIEHCGAPLEFHLAFAEYKSSQPSRKKLIIEEVSRTMRNFIHTHAEECRGDWDINI